MLSVAKRAKLSEIVRHYFQGALSAEKNEG
jgi:hypothetical protein